MLTWPKWPWTGFRLFSRLFTPVSSSSSPLWRWDAQQETWETFHGFSQMFPEQWLCLRRALWSQLQASLPAGPTQQREKVNWPLRKCLSSGSSCSEWIEWTWNCFPVSLLGFPDLIPLVNPLVDKLGEGLSVDESAMAWRHLQLTLLVDHFTSWDGHHRDAVALHALKDVVVHSLVMGLSWDFPDDWQRY